MYSLVWRDCDLGILRGGTVNNFGSYTTALEPLSSRQAMGTKQSRKAGASHQSCGEEASCSLPAHQGCSFKFLITEHSDRGAQISCAAELEDESLNSGHDPSVGFLMLPTDAPILQTRFVPLPKVPCSCMVST